MKHPYTYLHEHDPRSAKHRLVERTETCAVVRTGEWQPDDELAYLELPFASGFLVVATKHFIHDALFLPGNIYVLRSLKNVIKEGA